MSLFYIVDWLINWLIQGYKAVLENFHPFNAGFTFLFVMAGLTPVYVVVTV